MRAIRKMEPLEENIISDALGELFLVMRHHYQSFVLATAEGVYNLLYKSSMLKVKTMQGFVKNQQLWVLDKGAGQ